MTDQNHEPEESTFAEEPESTFAEEPADEVDEVDAEESSATSPPERRQDPMVTWMLAVILGIIIVLLGTTAALVLYLGSLNRAPRTAVERDVATWETAIHERPSDTNAWASLAYAYAEADRFDDALRIVSEAQKRTKESSLVLVRADVLRMAGRYSEATDDYDEAEKVITAALDETKRRRAKIGVEAELPDEGLTRVYSGRAQCAYELGEVDKAISDLEKALETAPQQATLWVTLGDYYSETGKNKEAVAAYREALKYVPDYAEALAGLEKVEK